MRVPNVTGETFLSTLGFNTDNTTVDVGVLVGLYFSFALLALALFLLRLPHAGGCGCWPWPWRRQRGGPAGGAR